MRISDWSSDVCSSDLVARDVVGKVRHAARLGARRGFEFVHGDDRAGTHRGDDALDLKILEHRFEQPRVAFERRLVDLSRRPRSEEHTSELQSLMRISYAVFCLKITKIMYHITH